MSINKGDDYMTPVAKQIIDMLDMLPEQEQQLANMSNILTQNIWEIQVSKK